jgi:hypothetical protein
VPLGRRGQAPPGAPSEDAIAKDFVNLAECRKDLGATTAVVWAAFSPAWVAEQFEAAMGGAPWLVADRASGDLASSGNVERDNSWRYVHVAVFRPA